jgi:site-specific DNA recombinase
VISKLTDFAAKVNDRLDSIDFNTKREIIRALVKRVEIYKDEVIVVFRVEPQSGLQSNNGGRGIKTEDSIMQDCKERHDTSLGGALCGFNHFTCGLNDRGLQPLSDQ